MPTMNFTEGDDTYVSAGSADDADPLILNFLGGNDRLRAQTYSTEAHMGDGNDYVRTDMTGRVYAFGDAGDDRFDLYSTNNVIDGGDGRDTFNILKGGYIVDRLQGGAGSDRFNFSVDAPYIAGAYHSYFLGGDGNDYFNGNGHDVGLIHGDAGNDFFTGMGGINSGDFSAAYGGTGNDVFRAMPIDPSSWGAPVFIENADEGIDTVQVAYGESYTLPDNVEILRALNFATVDGSAILTGNGLRNTIIGGTSAETLVGLGGNDHLYGSDGDDTLDGGSENDYLDGGSGKDLLSGGDGRDYFVFRDGGTGATQSTADQIADFAYGDRISLSAIDADSTLSGDQAFTFIGTAAFAGQAGEVRYELLDGNTYVSGDTNGDGSADFMIRLDGSHQLTSNDFLL